MWQTGDPPKHGYYLAAWRLRGRLAVSEMWFNPDAVVKWWLSRGYSGEHKQHPMDGAVREEVVAWMPMPTPPEGLS